MLGGSDLCTSVSFRQVQRLRDIEGAECEEHDHRCAGRPALLGAGLHVVSAGFEQSELELTRPL